MYYLLDLESAIDDLVETEMEMGKIRREFKREKEVIFR